MGKSCFLPYLILRLSKVVDVALQIGSRFYIYDFEKETSDDFDPKIHYSDYIDSCVFLSDIVGNTKDMYQSLSFMCRSVLVSSPDKDKINFFENFRSKSKLFMPTWHEKELLKCAELMKFDKDTCIYRMHHWGGIPRIVFAADEEYYHFRLSECLRDSAIVKKLCDRCNAFSLNDAEFSKSAQWLTPMLVYSDYREFRYDWASSYVALEFFKKVQNLDKQLSFRDVLRCADSPLLGLIYESAVRRTINSSSPVLNFYEMLGKAGKAVISTTPTTVQMPRSIRFVSFEKKSLGEERPSDHVFWPLSKTQSSFDFIKPPYIFQVTLQRKHAIKNPTPFNNLTSPSTSKYTGNDQYTLVFGMQTHIFILIINKHLIYNQLTTKKKISVLNWTSMFFELCTIRSSLHVLSRCCLSCPSFSCELSPFEHLLMVIVGKRLSICQCQYGVQVFLFWLCQV